MIFLYTDRKVQIYLNIGDMYEEGCVKKNKWKNTHLYFRKR